MFRAAVKLLVINERSSVLAAEQTAHPIQRSAQAAHASPESPCVRLAYRLPPVAAVIGHRHARPAVRRGCGYPVVAFYPSTRGARGSLRLCSLEPDLLAAVPSPLRSRARDPVERRTRSTRANTAAAPYVAFSTAPAGLTPVVA